MDLDIVFISTRHKGHHLWRVNQDKVSLVDIKLPFELGFLSYQVSSDTKRLLMTKRGNIDELDMIKQTHHQFFNTHHASYVANYDVRDENNVIYNRNHLGEWQLWLFERESNQHTQHGGYRVISITVTFIIQNINGLFVV